MGKNKQDNKQFPAVPGRGVQDMFSYMRDPERMASWLAGWDQRRKEMPEDPGAIRRVHIIIPRSFFRHEEKIVTDREELLETVRALRKPAMLRIITDRDAEITLPVNTIDLSPFLLALNPFR